MVKINVFGFSLLLLFPLSFAAQCFMVQWVFFFLLIAVTVTSCLSNEERHLASPPILHLMAFIITIIYIYIYNHNINYIIIGYQQ